jgi:hypothetical protein
MAEYSREQLVDLCERAVVPMSRWYNRDSSRAQSQIGEAWVLLRAGAPFYVIRQGHLATDERTIWVLVEWKGFSAFELGLEEGGMDDATFYIPTEERLASAAGGDWY